MLIEKILENQDFESINLINPTRYEGETRDLIEYIQRTGNFDAEKIGVDLSFSHAVLYMELCNAEAARVIEKDLIEHLIKRNDCYES